jgi:hypothetical protein
MKGRKSRDIVKGKAKTAFTKIPIKGRTTRLVKGRRITPSEYTEVFRQEIEDGIQDHLENMRRSRVSSEEVSYIPVMDVTNVGKDPTYMVPWPKHLRKTLTKTGGELQAVNIRLPEGLPIPEAVHGPVKVDWGSSTSERIAHTLLKTSDNASALVSSAINSIKSGVRAGLNVTPIVVDVIRGIVPSISDEVLNMLQGIYETYQTHRGV